MDLFSGLQSLFGGEPPSARQKEGASERTGRDLQKKNSRLKEMLDAARARIADLEKQIDSMKEERTNVAENINTQREEIDQLIAEMNGQIREMTDALNRQTDSMESIEEIREMLERLEAQRDSLAEINERSEHLKEEVLDRIHTENVACYRNMKSLITELREDVNEMELSEESIREIRSSFRGMTVFSVFALLSFIALVVVLLIEFGVIPT